MPGVLKTDVPNASMVAKDSKTTQSATPSTSPTDPSRPSASRPLFPGLGLTYDDRFLRSILKPKDPSFDGHRRTIFLNLRDNTLAGWHKLALEGRAASEAEEAELLKSEMQLRAMGFGYLAKQDASKSSGDRTVCSIRSNECMWRTLTQDCTPKELEDEQKLRERLLRLRAAEALQTQALISALRIGNCGPFDRAFVSTLSYPQIQLVKAEADRLRDRMRVHGLPAETVDDAVRRRKLCEEWFGGVFVWPKDDGRSVFAYLDEWKPSTLASESGALPTIKIECVLDALSEGVNKMTVQGNSKTT